MRCGLQELLPPRSGVQRYAKTELVAATPNRALKSADRDVDVAEGLREFILIVAERCDNAQLARLREATRAGGFDLRVIDGESRMLPLDEPELPLGELVSALEADLRRTAMAVTGNHYRQAVDSLADGRPESANAQLHAMFEDIVANLAALHGFSRSNQGAGGTAIRYLIQHGHLPEMMAETTSTDYGRSFKPMARIRVRRPWAKRTSETTR